MTAVYLAAAASAALSTSRDDLLKNLEDQFYFHERIPLVLSANLDCLTGHGGEALDETEQFNESAIKLAWSRFAPMRTNLARQSLRKLSWGQSIKHLCGLERPQFWKLYDELLPALAQAFPHSPLLDGDHGEEPHFADLSFRLFVVLFVLRTGTPLDRCRFLFGWSKTSTHRWFDAILDIIVKELAKYREFPDEAQQRLMAVEHLLYLRKTQDDDCLDMYNTRINFDTEEMEDEDLQEARRVFNGAFASTDCTFSIQPSFPSAIQQLMYTGYKKYHAYKLCVVNSLFTKCILALRVAPARVSDKMVLGHDLALNARIGKGQFILGDDAFNGRGDIVVPFTSAQIAAVSKHDPRLGAKMARWNHAHSSNRISSEHVIGALKQWACIRGTGKHFMFRTHEGFERAVQAVHSLHNASVCNFDITRLYITRRR